MVVGGLRETSEIPSPSPAWVFALDLSLCILLSVWSFTPRSACFVRLGKFLATLDGGDMSSYFDFLFEPTPACPTHWVFKDEDAREDFVQGAQDEGCMVSLKEVPFGITLRVRLAYFSCCCIPLVVCA